MKRPIYLSKLVFITMFDKLFYLKSFLNNYFENLLFFENYFFLKCILKISFLKNKFDILVIFYIHNFKYIYFPKCLILK